MTTLAPFAGETSADAPPASADGPAMAHDPMTLADLDELRRLVDLYSARVVGRALLGLDPSIQVPAQLDRIEAMVLDLQTVANALNASAGQAMAQLTGGGLPKILGALMGRG